MKVFLFVLVAFLIAGLFIALAIKLTDVQEKKSRFVYEFDESPAKQLHSNEINLIATKITVDGKILKNRYGKTDV